MRTKCKKSLTSTVKTCVYVFFGILFTCYFCLPLFVLLIRSFMTAEEIARIPSALWPSSFHFRNFTYAFTELETEVNFALSLFNSVYIMVLRTIGTVSSSFLAAYALARIKFRGSKLLFMFGMSTVMIPGMVTMLPMFKLYSQLGWVNTHLPLWAPAWFGGGMMVIFLEMQFIRSIPKSLDEAAQIDGANHLRIAFSIILPMVKAVLIYEAVGCMIGTWNDFMGPLTYISRANTELYTFPLAFFIQFPNSGSVRKSLPNVQAALSLIMMIPTVTLFIVFHNQMIDGISLGGGLKS